MPLGALLLLAGAAAGKVLHGELDSHDSWVYLTSFCFTDATTGTIGGTMRPGAPGHQLLLYSDAQHTSWPAVGALSASCERRVNQSSNIQQLRAGDHDKQFRWVVPPPRGSARPHRWFVAVANCAGRVQLQSYELSLVNGGPWWRRHFSCELAAVLPMYGADALMLAALLALLLLVCTALRRAAQRSDGVPAVLSAATFAAACSTVGALLSAAHLWLYASRGYGVEALRVLGGAAEVCSQLSLLVLVLWTVRQLCQEPSYGAGGPPPPRQLYNLLGTLALSQLALWVWATRSRADGSFFLLSYSTVPGMLMLATRCGIAVYVLGQAARLSDGRAPRRFVLLASALVGAWLLLPPLAAAVAGWAPFWRSQQLVGAAHLCVQLLGFAGVLAVYWPWQRRVWCLPQAPHLELPAVPYETIQ